MLLLISGSGDGTSDLLVNEIESANVFRFNYDLFADYKLEFTPQYWRIENPTGHWIDSNVVSSVFWWKAFSFYIQDEDEFIVQEIKYIFREIYHWCRLRGLLKGNPPDFHNHLGKMNILSIASRHFRIPKTLATFNLAGVGIFHDEVVAKSFTSGLTTTNAALFTTKVQTNALNPKSPWFLQELINSSADVTIFICNDVYYPFFRDRSSLKSIDWRSEQEFDPCKMEWFPFKLSPGQIGAMDGLCSDLKVGWGRVDLMTDGNELIFLEFNANGQWVFLDYMGKAGLVKAVCEYLIPLESRIGVNCQAV